MSRKQGFGRARALNPEPNPGPMVETRTTQQDQIDMVNGVIQREIYFILLILDSKKDGYDDVEWKV